MTSFANDQNLPNGPTGATPSWQAWSYAQLTASGSVKAAPGYVAGIICAASSSGVVTLYDNTAGSGTVVWSGSVTTGGMITFPAPIYFATGIYFTLVSGTTTCNVVYR